MRTWLGLGWLGVGAALLGLALAAACSPSDTIKGSKSGGDGGSGGAPVAVAVACDAYCEGLHGAGTAEYEAFRLCLACRACFDRCSPELGSVCDGNVELGCSATSPDCATCTASACAAEQLPDTTFQGACAAEGNACAANPECVARNNCATSCVVAGGPPAGSGGADAGTGAGVPVGGSGAGATP